LAPFLPFLINLSKFGPYFTSPSKYFSALLCFSAEISTPWQHCLSGHLEKKDADKSKIGAAKSKRNPQKHFAHRQVPSQLWSILSNEKPEMHTFVMFYI
jgi:hypothetical protein